MRRALWAALACLSLATAPALQDPETRDALNLGRSHDQLLYDAFNAGYRLAVSGSVDRAEIITEFRRAVLIVRAHADQGEYAFNAKNLAEAMRPFRGLATFGVSVRLHPHNTYVTPPTYDLYVRTGPQTKPLAPPTITREPIYPLGFSPPGTAMVGVRLEASFPRADIAAAPEPSLVVLDATGEILWQVRIDLARFR